MPGPTHLVSRPVSFYINDMGKYETRPVLVVRSQQNEFPQAHATQKRPPVVTKPRILATVPYFGTFFDL